MIVYSVEERLFDTYGESVLKQQNPSPCREVIDFLDSLPIEEDRRIDLYDKVDQLYLRCSTDAFSIGLHLGLSLLGNNIRRPGPEQAQ